MDDRVTLMILRADGGQTILELPMLYQDRYLKISSRRLFVNFIADINQTLIKKVEKLRKGQDLKVSIRTETVYAEIDPDSRQFGKVKYLYAGGLGRTTNVKIVTAREWIENVLVPAGYGKRLILEIPLSFPEFPPSLPAKGIMKDFRDQLIRAIEDLNRAYEDYLNYRNDSSVDRVRESLDAFRRLIKDRKGLLLTELLERTSTCSQNISSEIFDSIINIIDSLYNIASKGPHAVTRSGLLFDFRPNSEDSEALICGLLGVLIFLSNKLEKRLQLT